MNTEERLRAAIKQAAGRGFTWFRVDTSRGDSNCPHPVTYSPKDGHGFETECRFFDLEDDGTTAAYDEECEYGDPLEVLCRLFESMPEIKERELINQAKAE